MLRSLLFVPADRPDRFEKAASSGADAIILDLEDSVALGNKPAAREAAARFLATPRIGKVTVRINAIDSGMMAEDLSAVLSGKPDAIVLPKAEGAASVRTLLEMMGTQAVPVLPIATETPAAVFELGTYAEVAAHLVGLTWGAEDLPAAIGAVTSREEDGRYTPPIEMARSLTLFGAHKAGVAAIETVFPDIRNEEGLGRYLQRARRDGFTGMMAIHPGQVAAINAAFTPSEEELAHAREVVALFEQTPDLGVAQLHGKMVDRPHLRQAQALLARAINPR